MKVVHVITGLGVGGAETALHRLLSHWDRRRFQAEVFSLTDEGPMADRIRALGVPVRTIGMRPGLPDPLGLIRLAGWLRAARPDLVQTWMYHADLLGGLAAKYAVRAPVVWGVRHANLDPHVNKRSTVWTAKTCARLSHRLPARIVCCAEVVLKVHARIGYDESKMVVIPNGFDLEAFRPDPAARPVVRRELGIPAEAPLVGLIGRFHPQKDHRTFIGAAALLHEQMPDVHFLLAGTGVTWENEILAGWIRAAGIQERCHLLGRRDDVPRLMAALDVAASSSVGEGFPNIIGEAMACGVPCAVTDVGDSAQIVGDTGRVVAPGAPEALARALHELLAAGREERLRLGDAARRRIEEKFSISAVVARYEQLYEEVAAGVRHRRVA